MNRECYGWVQGWSLPERYEFFVKKVPLPIEKYQGPGLVVEWMKIEGPLGPWPPESYQRLFKDVPLKARSVAKAEAENKTPPKIAANRPESFWQNYDPLVPASAKPKEDAERLIRDFLPRALRRPVSEELQKHYVKLVHERLDEKYTFVDAMMFGYKSILSSTDFLFLREPGSPQLTDKKDFRSTRLDDYASRTGFRISCGRRCPMRNCCRAAEKGELTKPAILRAQVERMLKDAKAHRFTENFAGQWLDLRKINATMPDPQLYSEFDQFLLWSMPRETELFFEEILTHDRSLLEFVDSDWSMLNERLAQHYGIPDVVGNELRKVKLPAGSHRGGVMTQASVLKVTADGTRTSPVLRGKWVLERILGKPPAPPPPGHSAVRAGHPRRHDDPPAARQAPQHARLCHVPRPHRSARVRPGELRPDRRLARLLSRHEADQEGRREGQTLLPRPRRRERRRDARGQGVQEHRRLQEDPARRQGPARPQPHGKLLIYATGADIQFADREVVEQIVARLRTQRLWLPRVDPRGGAEPGVFEQVGGSFVLARGFRS